MDFVFFLEKYCKVQGSWLKLHYWRVHKNSQRCVLTRISEIRSNLVRVCSYIQVFALLIILNPCEIGETFWIVYFWQRISVKLKCVLSDLKSDIECYQICSLTVSNNAHIYRWNTKEHTIHLKPIRSPFDCTPARIQRYWPPSWKPFNVDNFTVMTFEVIEKISFHVKRKKRSVLETNHEHIFIRCCFDYSRRRYASEKLVIRQGLGTWNADWTYHQKT